MATHWDLTHSIQEPFPVKELEFNKDATALLVMGTESPESGSRSAAKPCLLWSLVSGSVIGEYEVERAVWSPCGRWCGIIDESGLLSIIDVATGAIRFSTSVKERSFSIGSWCPDGMHLFTQWAESDSRGLSSFGSSVWDIEAGQEIFRLPDEQIEGWSPDGRLVTSREGAWILESGADVVRWDPRMFSPKWSPDSEFVAVQNDVAVEIWSAVTGDPVAKVPLVGGWPVISWAHDGTSCLVATSTTGPTFQYVYRSVDLRSGVIEHRHESPDPSINKGSHIMSSHQSWSPAGRMFASHECWCGSATDDRVYVHDVVTSRVVAELQDARSFKWSHDGAFLATCNSSMKLHVNTIREASAFRVVGSIRGFGFETPSADGSRFAMIAEDLSAIHVWEPWAIRRVGELRLDPDVVNPNQEWIPSSYAWSFDMKCSVIRRSNGTIVVWAESARAGSEGSS